MQSLDPLLFNGIRFGLGALCIYFIRLFSIMKDRNVEQADAQKILPGKSKLFPLLILGILLFVAASFQQIGMLWTSAGNAGFITGLYVVFVPLIGLLRKQRFRGYMVIAVFLSVAGLFLLNSTSVVSVTRGNILVLIGAVFWAGHVQYIDKVTKYIPVLDLALAQFTICSLLSLLFGSINVTLVQKEVFSVAQMFIDLKTLIVPVMYAGIMSVGVAFTLQLYAQKRVKPHTASIILCLEGVFALLGGRIFLNEVVTLSSLFGSILLLLSMLLCLLGDRGLIFLIDKKGHLKN